MAAHGTMGDMTSWGWSAVEPWLQSVLPRNCAGCQRVGRLWCPACSVAVRSQRAALVPAPMGAPGIVAVAGEHRDLLRSAVLLHKSRHHAGVFADLVYLAAACLALVRAVLRALRGSPRHEGAHLALVPVPPSSPSAWRSPAGEVARSLAAGSVDVSCYDLLRSRRRRTAQKSLDAAGRARNVVGAFELNPRRSVRRHTEGTSGGAVAVLIDDVVTTGATLSQARMVVESAGFVVPAAIALTRTPGPSP